MNTLTGLLPAPFHSLTDELTTEDQKWIDYKEKEGLLRMELTTAFLVLMRGYPEAKGSVCKQAFHAALTHVHPSLKHK